MHLMIMLLTLLAPSLALSAGTIYKSVDKQGNVTYSSKPPAAGVRTERLAVPPPPTEEDVRRAEEQAQKLKEQAARLEQERKAREQGQGVAGTVEGQPGDNTELPLPILTAPPPPEPKPPPPPPPPPSVR